MARIGRGGKRGKTSGKGTKGQKARSGNSMRPEIRDMIKKLPKLRGHGKNRARTVNEERVRPLIVNVGALEAVFGAGDAVDPQALLLKGLVHTRRKGTLSVKILGAGEIKKKLTLSGCAVSEEARKKIEAAGGTVR
jgi:large subunit ribosomal protein L15